MTTTVMNRSRLRFIVGLAISALFIGLTLSRIDVNKVAEAILAAAPLGLVVGLVLVSAEVWVRARRWQLLLNGIRPVPYRLALAYLYIGYFANGVLPARLGDIARAYVGGSVLGTGRLPTFGTIVIERVTDASMMVLIVIGLGLLRPAASELSANALLLGGVGVVGLAVLLVGLVLLRRGAFTRYRVVQLGLDMLARIAVGGAALRWPVKLVAFVGLTLGGFSVAIAAFASIAAAVGLHLSLIEAAIVMAALALSTAIPAAPASLGTYEFIGLTVLVQLGAPPDAALAAVLLIHVFVTIPSAILGLVATWLLHVRVSTLVEDAALADSDTTTGRLGQDPVG
jgi:glycosyltransferase 2 family protein